MYRKIIITALISIFFAGFLQAQQIPIDNQHWVNKFSVVPAYAGLSGHTEAFVDYRQNWVGMKGAPSIANVNLNGQFLGSMGYGFSATAERSGNFTQFYATGTYAYHIKFSDDMFLNFGLSPHIFRNQINMSTVESYGTQLDPMLQNNSGLAITAYDVGISTVFVMSKLEFGVSVPRTVGMSFNYKDTDTDFRLKRHYNVYATWNEEIGNVVLSPVVMLRTTEKSEFSYEAGAMAKFNKKLWLGASYRADNSIATMIGGAVGDRLVINYNYEFGIGGLSTATSGTHEFTMGFLLNQNKDFRNYTAFHPPISGGEGGDNSELLDRIDELDAEIKDEKSKRELEIKRLEDKIDKLHEGGTVETNGTPNPNPPGVDDEEANKIKWLYMENPRAISFGQGGSRLLSSSYGELDKYTSKLTTDPQLKIRIDVHTDNTGSPSQMMELSEARAESVKSYMISKGVKEEQIYPVGYGSTKPINSNDTPEGRQKNNRIVVSFNKKI